MFDTGLILRNNDFRDGKMNFNSLDNNPFERFQFKLFKN